MMDPQISPTSSSKPAKKPRFKWQPEQLEVLEALFATTRNPSTLQMEQVAAKHSADISNVKSWFTNRRAKEKRKSTAADEDDEWAPNKSATTATTDVQQDDLSDIPSIIPFAGVPNSHKPILETDVTKLHARIKELEAENHNLKKQLARQQNEPDIGGPPLKKSKKGGKSESERLFHAWGKRLSTQAKTVKFYGSWDPAEVVVEESLTKELFTQCFVGKGVTIQPAPQNKPKSKVWIISFPTWESIEKLFQPGNIKKDGHIAWMWSKGGVPQRGFGFFGGGGGGFSKSEKGQKTTASVKSLTVHYNEIHSKLQLKFVCTAGGGGFGDYNSDDEC